MFIKYKVSTRICRGF